MPNKPEITKLVKEITEKEIEKHVGKNPLSKEEFARLYEEFRFSANEEDSGTNDLNLNDIKMLARQITANEIEKHAADGLGRVDYALASGGAMVVKHSTPYVFGKFSTTNRRGVHNDAEKMLKPSFGEPGQCFPMKGHSGFVEIKLRTTIIPEAVTLEHVAESVAYDNNSNAPRECRVYGWLGVDNAKTLITEFTYDLEKSNAQTFSVLPLAATALVDTIRFEFTSNHGSPSHTCIYRVRVHGHEPNSLSVSCLLALNDPDSLVESSTGFPLACIK